MGDGGAFDIESVVESPAVETSLRQRFSSRASDIESVDSRQRVATHASDLESSAFSDSVTQSFEFSCNGKYSDHDRFQWFPDGNTNSTVPWLGIDFSFEENEYPAPPVLKRRFQSMLAWTEREARALQAGDNAQSSKGKRQPALEDRSQCRSVELKLAVRSPGPGRPHSICSHCWGHGRGKDRSPPPPFRARRANVHNSSEKTSTYNDDGGLMDESFTEVLLTTSLCSRDPGSSSVRPSSRSVYPDWPGPARALSPSGVPVKQSHIQQAATGWQSFLRTAEVKHVKTRERFLVTAELASAPMIPRSLMLETNKGLMGGTFFMDDDGLSPYAPTQREPHRVFKKQVPPRKPRCLGALKSRCV